MRKKLIIICIMLVALSGLGMLSGCDGGGESKAVTRNEHIRLNYSKEMEAKHDAEGREHIEIPEGAQTITVEGIEYNVIDNFGDMNIRSSNYILSQNVKSTGSIGEYGNAFTGRFHGNNYKVYGYNSGALFKFVDGAVVQNVIFSASENTSSTRNDGVLIRYADKSVIKDCVNYFQPEYYLNDERDAVYPMISAAENCEISGLVNYADMIAFSGAILGSAGDNVTIKKCENYGNIINKNGANKGAAEDTSMVSCNGGIVGSLEGENILVEDCINYGNLVGTSCIGGIVGMIDQTDELASFFDPTKSEYFLDSQIIRNCKNFGDIYLIKEDGAKRVESTGYTKFPNVFCIGGIAGSASITENCVNEGNFYGFESLGKKMYVDYMGGIAGAAKKVTNCENKGTWNIHKGRAKNVGDLVGFTIV